MFNIKTLFFNSASVLALHCGYVPSRYYKCQYYRQYIDILQQQQRKSFLRQRHISTQRAEADVEDQIYHIFKLESLLVLEDVHFIFLYV